MHRTRSISTVLAIPIALVVTVLPVPGVRTVPVDAADGGGPAASPDRLDELGPRRLRDLLAFARDAGDDALILTVCEAIRDEVGDDPEIRRIHARAAVRLWTDRPAEPERFAEAVLRWREVALAGDDAGLARLQEARLLSHARHHPEILEAPGLLDELTARLGPDDPAVRRLSAHRGVRRRVLQEPETFASRVGRDLAARRFGPDDRATRAVEQAPVRSGPPTGDDLARLAADPLRDRVESLLQRAARGGLPAVVALLRWTAFRPLRDDLDLQVRLLAAFPPAPEVPRDPFGRPGSEAPDPDGGDEGPDVREELRTTLASGVPGRGPGDPAWIVAVRGELHDLVERVREALADVDDPGARRTLILEVTREVRAIADRHPGIGPVLALEVPDRLAEHLLERLREVADEGNLVDVRRTADEIELLTSAVRRLAPGAPELVGAIEEETDRLLRQTERVVEVRRTLEAARVTGILRGPDERMAIVGGRVYRIGEVLRTADGLPVSGVVLTEIDELGRVRFAWEDRTFTLRLSRPGSGGNGS